MCTRTCRARRVSCVAVSSPWRWVTSCRMRCSSCLSASPSRMTCCTRLGVCEIAAMTVRWPRSIRFASTTSSSRVKSGTRLISARYTRTRSLDESGRLGVRSISSASLIPASEPCTRSLERLRVDVDVGVPTLIEQVVQHRRRGDVDRQDDVNLLGAQVSSLPSNGDELVNGLVLFATRHRGPGCS